MGGSGVLCSIFKVLHDLSCIVYFTCWFVRVKLSLSVALSLSLSLGIQDSDSGLWVYNLEGPCFSETLVSVYNLNRSQIPKDHNLDTQWKPEELRSLSQLCQLFLKLRRKYSVSTKECSTENRRWIEPVTLEGPDKSTLKFILSKKETYTLGLFVPSTVWALTFTPTINRIGVWFCWFGSASLPASYVFRTTQSS